MEKRYDFSADAERAIYDDWESCGAFRCRGDAGGKQKAYTLMMPPPNVTGRLHIGHALDNTLQDILVRYHRMRGFDCLWLPGTDHAGIATQLLVSKQLSASGIDCEQLTREEFLERIWHWKQEYGGIILQQLRRLGASCDWSRVRFTMDEGLSRSVRHAFLRMYEDGLIYRAERLVNWDPQLETAISDLEVRQQSVSGKLCLVDYPLVVGEADASGSSAATVITVATMRPETLFGDSAVAVHPEDERYSFLVGRRCRVPLTGRSVPIIADSRVDREQGTGALKITPAHDFLDFAIGLDHSLELRSIFDKHARLNDDVPAVYRGLSREQARKAVIATLASHGLLRAVREEEHSVPHGERSGVALEPRLTRQWFVRMDILATRALRAVDSGETILLPQIWNSTWRNWLENIQPWCISRQLLWGHRIPIWYTAGGDEIAAYDESEAMLQAKRRFGGSVSLVQDEDVLDTWFSSSLWPFSTLGWGCEGYTDKFLLRHHFPTDILVTGFDILFFWVARMMMMSLYFMGCVPFRVVYLHALIRDASGRKMSKSLGNVINPIDLMDRYGCDALRFTLSLQAIPGRDLRLAEKRIEGNRNFITKLWNSARFLEIQDCRYDKDFAIWMVRGALHRWMLVRLREAVIKVEHALDDKVCMFHEAGSVLYHFLWDVFCDQYLEMVKSVLLTGNAAEKAEARFSSAWIFYGLLRMLHPFVPFVSEKIFCTAEIFASCGREERLITSRWLAGEDIAVGDWLDAVDEVEWILGLVREVRSLRSCLGISPKMITPLRYGDLSALAAERLGAWGGVMRCMASIECCAREDNCVGDEEVVGFAYEGFVDSGLGLPLDFTIDDASKRVEKQLRSYQDEYRGLEGKLNNVKFTQNAPRDIQDSMRLKSNRLDKSITSLRRIKLDLERK